MFVGCSLRTQGFIVLLSALVSGGFLRADEDLTLQILSPRRWEVFQRQSYDPTKSADGSHSRGAARVPIQAQLKGLSAASDASDRDLRVYCRVTHFGGENEEVAGWKSAQVVRDGLKFETTLTIPAGGWYRLEIRTILGDRQTESVTEPFGVGEVFVVAGQSYATNTNDETLRVTDPRERVAAFSLQAGEWAAAHDPQPTADASDGGSIWPAVGDQLVRDLDVPVGFANVAFGGTSSSQWLPGQPLHDGLVRAGRSLGRFRAILWQQGESDVINGTTTDVYLDNVRRIQKAAVRAWGFQPTWLAAKSTHHPTVYNNPEGEARIRTAVEQLWKLPGFGAGPDTDSLTGENRGGAGSRRHFSAIGQQRAAAMWHAVLMERLNSPPDAEDSAGFLLRDLHLLEPAWSSEVVHRESCILQMSDEHATVTASLAFPATEILHIHSADGLHSFTAADDVSSDASGQKLIFRNRGPISPIRESDRFLPAGAPNSYRHRIGFPDQNLLYQPGRWFHDRNIEVTYRRASSPASSAEPLTFGTLPRLQSRLKAGLPVILGISGDSISTGLDASILTGAVPLQPGYPELVAAQLRVLCDSDITLINRSVAGWSVANGVSDLENLLASRPDLIVVAYGMNDVGRRDPLWYREQTEKLIETARQANPEIEVLLVAPMLGNRDWVHTPREFFGLYRDQLRSLVTSGTAMADLTEVWSRLVQHKSDLDLTGNGLNHPNDFGHRLYAQCILQVLIQGLDL